ncbi:MAG: hypothetical protein LRY61_06255 [Burkholderiaceae bacterium]|nr:hypothetical protein [Burkholderiaceae bacterium]
MHNRNVHQSLASAEVSFEALKKLLPRISVAHHIPERIRLKIDISLDEIRKSDLQPVKDFQAVLDRLPGIREVKLNMLAKSSTIRYDKNVIPFELGMIFWRKETRRLP